MARMMKAAEAGEPRFENFDLTVQLGPDNIPWISASSRIGLLHGIPRTDPEIPALEDLLDLVYDYRDAVQFAESEGGAEISRALGLLVFGDPMVLELFQATRGAAADRRKPVLVRILASPHLATLPWELLPDPATWSGGDHQAYLTLARDAHVIRMARGRSYATRTQPLTPPLNLLVILSSPTALDPADDSLAFDIYEVKRNLLNELKPLTDNGLINVDVEERPTLENLRRRIGSQARGYHIFHYVGHALPDHLVLEDEAGRRRDQVSARITEILRLCPDLRLAVFAGCETARPHADAQDLDPRLTVGWRDLVSLADRCVQEAAPVVVGMQAVLPFRTERLLTRFFYQGLASGYSIAESVHLARGAARSDARVAEGLLDWSVPAVFLSGGEPGPLIARGSPGAPVPAKRRFDLKIDLRQSETRFFARDLPLRQSIEVLASKARERVLVVTGPPGVGKTCLIDRALDELTPQPTHVMYVKVGRLLPAFELALKRLRDDDKRWARSLEDGSDHAGLGELCTLVSELLSRSEGKPRKAPALVPTEWWERLVEDVTRERFLLVIDEFELFDDLLDACFCRWLPTWMTQCMRTDKTVEQGVSIGMIEEFLEILRAPLARTSRNNPARVWFDSIRQLLEQHSRVSPWRWSVACRSLESIVLPLLESTTLTAAGVEDILGTRSRASVLRQEIDRSTRIPQLIDANRAALETALRQIAERRSDSRIAVITSTPRKDLLGMSADDRFELRLGHLTWQETWRWVRRNLPGLNRFGAPELVRLWTQLGIDLDRWEELERQVLAQRGGEVNLAALASALSSQKRRRRKTPRVKFIGKRRGERPLRVAVAGPYVRSPEALADAITRLASDYGIGGRVTFGLPATAGDLAVLIERKSPFSDPSVTLSEKVLLQWLNEVIAKRPDIVLLDYGNDLDAGPYELRETPERALFQRLAHRSLFIAAGGNSGPGYLSEPAVFPEVLAIGSLDEFGVPRPHASWASARAKPDLFMPDDLTGSPLADALSLGGQDRIEGSSFAALNAVGAAILVWSILPRLLPRELRELLVKSARRIDKGSKVPRARLALTLDAAVGAARRKVIELALAAGPCSMQTLTAVTGQEAQPVEEALRQLVSAGQVERIPTGRLDRFQWVG